MFLYLHKIIRNDKGCPDCRKYHIALFKTLEDAHSFVRQHVTDEDIDWSDFYEKNELWIDKWVRKNNGELHVIFKIEKDEFIKLYSGWQTLGSNIKNDDDLTVYNDQHKIRCDEVKSTLDNLFIPYYDPCLSKLICDYVPIEPVNVLLRVDIDHSDPWNCPNNILVSLLFPQEIPTEYFDQLITRDELVEGVVDEEVNHKYGTPDKYHFVRLIEMEFNTIYFLNEWCHHIEKENWDEQVHNIQDQKNAIDEKMIYGPG